MADKDCVMWWEQRLESHKFHDKGEVEWAVREWLQMQDSEF